MADPKTGTKSKFLMSTMFLFWKLTEVEAGKHLRDFSQDIVDFAKYLASRLDISDNGKPTLTPWDFVREWDVAIDARKFTDFCAIFDGGPQTKEQDAVDRIDKMMPIFAEDLCGKEFAEVAVLYQEGLPKPTPNSAVEVRIIRGRLVVSTGRFITGNTPLDTVVFDEGAAQKSKGVAHELAHLREMREEGMISPLAPHFPPEKPVIISEAEHVPAPPDAEFGNHLEAEPMDPGFHKDGVRQPEQESGKRPHRFQHLMDDDAFGEEC